MTGDDESAEVAKVLQFRDEVVASLTQSYGHLTSADEVIKLAPAARAEAHRFRRWVLDSRINTLTEERGYNPLERLVAGKLHGLPREMIADPVFDTKVLAVMTAKPEFMRRANRVSGDLDVSSSGSSDNTSNGSSSSSDGSDDSDGEDNEGDASGHTKNDDEVVVVGQTGGLPTAAQLGPPPNLPAKPMSQLDLATSKIREKLLLLKQKQQQQNSAAAAATASSGATGSKRTRDYESDNDDDYQPELKKDSSVQPTEVDEEEDDDYVPSLGLSSENVDKKLKNDVDVNKKDEKEKDDSSSSSSSSDSESSNGSSSDTDSSSDSGDSDGSDSSNDDDHSDGSSSSSSSSSGEESDYEPTITSITSSAPPLKQEPSSQLDYSQQQYQQPQQQYQQVPFNPQQQQHQQRRYTPYYNPSQLPSAPMAMGVGYPPYQAPGLMVPTQPAFYTQQPPLPPAPQPYQVPMHASSAPTHPRPTKQSKKQMRYNRYNKRQPNSNPGPGPSFGDDGLSGLY